MTKRDGAEHKLIVGDEILLYGIVGDGFYWGDYFTAKEVAEALAMFEDDVTVRINSGGGIAMEGRAIYSLFKDFDGTVTMIVDSIAASAASVIAMAGETVRMTQGSVLMIHDPRGYSSGTAKDHDRNAKSLDKLANEFAKTYAARTGIAVDEIRQMMIAETWLTAEEAIAQGFADEAIDEGEAEEATASLFNYAMYRNAPEHLMTLARAAAAHFELNPAPANNSKETAMGTPNPQAPATPAPTIELNTPPAAPANPTPPAVATMSADDVRHVIDQAGKAGLTLADTNKILGEAKSRDAAMNAIIDMIADKSANPPNPLNATVTLDARDKFVEGAAASLMLKAGVAEKAGKGAERNEFSGLSLMELARHSLTLQGVSGVTMMTKFDVVGKAFTMAGGMHSTSDFANILSNVARKSVLKGYDEAEETFDLWTSTGYVSDFKPTTRVDLGLFPSLAKVDEGAEYTFGKMGDRGVTVAIATYGRMIAFTRQAIINDDLSLLGSVPMKMGRAAKRTVGNLVYAVLNTNPNFADGAQLFHASHNNLAGSLAAPSEATLQTAYNAMGKQKDDDENAVALNIRPKYILHNNYRFLLKQLLESEGSIADNKSAKVINTVQGLVEPIEERRITENTWFLAADPNQYDTIEVTYLDGQSSPRVESEKGWTIDGTEMKVALDAGVNAIGYRGLYKGQ